MKSGEVVTFMAHEMYEGGGNGPDEAAPLSTPTYQPPGVAAALGSYTDSLTVQGCVLAAYRGGRGTRVRTQESSKYTTRKIETEKLMTYNRAMGGERRVPGRPDEAVCDACKGRRWTVDPSQSTDKTCRLCDSDRGVTDMCVICARWFHVKRFNFTSMTQGMGQARRRPLAVKPGMTVLAPFGRHGTWMANGCEL